jgi:hypothetical protein
MVKTKGLGPRRGPHARAERLDCEPPRAGAPRSPQAAARHWQRGRCPTSHCAVDWSGRGDLSEEGPLRLDSTTLTIRVNCRVRHPRPCTSAALAVLASVRTGTSKACMVQVPSVSLLVVAVAGLYTGINLASESDSGACESGPDWGTARACACRHPRRLQPQVPKPGRRVS